MLKNSRPEDFSRDPATCSYQEQGYQIVPIRDQQILVELKAQSLFKL